jgi:beta-glucanase (GH16 family)
MLRLITTSDGPKHWFAGGLCQCGHPMLYGAFFVRSKISGAGPNEVQLLWPKDNQWPPEVDFNESGARWAATSGTVHFGSPRNDHFLQQNFPGVDLRRWHTWGIIWTPTSITYTFDGHRWGSAVRAPGVIPQLPMTLDFQQRPECQLGVPCPNQHQAMYIDWVAEYAPNAAH